MEEDLDGVEDFIDMSEEEGEDADQALFGIEEDADVFEE